MRPFRAHAAFLVFLASGGFLVASCSSGSVNTTPVATPAPAAPITQSVPTGGGSLTINSPTSQVATVGFASGVPSGVSLTATSSTSAPSGALAPSAVKRATQAITGAVPFFFVTFSVSANLSTAFLANETVSLTSAQPATAQYFAEVDDITAAPFTKLGTVGPATVSGAIATIVNGISGTNAPLLTAGHTYLFQFYYVPAAAASPTPTASPTASASPSASPSSSASPSAQASASGLGSPNLSSAGGAFGIPPLNNAAYSGEFTYSAFTGAATLAATVTDANYLAGISPEPPMPSGATTIYMVFNIVNSSSSSAISFTGSANGSASFTVPGLASGTIVKVHVYEDPVNQGYVDIGHYPASAVAGNGIITFGSPFQAPTCTSSCGNNNPGPSPFFAGDSLMVILSN